MLPPTKYHKLHYANQYMKPFCGTESPLVTTSLTRSDCKSCEIQLAKKWNVPVNLFRRLKSEAKEEARTAIEEFLIRTKEREGSEKESGYKLGHRKDS